MTSRIVADPKLVLLALPVLVVALLGVVGTTSTGSGDSAPTAAAAGDGSVTIEGFEFITAELTVPVGTEVTWTNVDTAKHSIEDVSGAFEESSALGTGDAFSFTYDQPGSQAYICGIHPYMRGTVIVEG